MTKLASAAQSASALDGVPILDLKRQYAQIGSEVLAAVERVCASQHYILGAEMFNTSSGLASRDREKATARAITQAVGESDVEGIRR